MLEAILLRLFAPCINLFTDMVNLVIRRDKSIVLFGAWMGEKFADNSRYLFQYLHEHGEEYGIHKVVWVTRKRSVCQMLRKMGYICYEMHDWQSFYYHFRAGYHINCNMNFATKKYKGDFMGQFSSGAMKYNLWHGIPIKAGGFTNQNHCNDSVLKKLLFSLRLNATFMKYFTPGRWTEAKYASTGKICTERCCAFHGLTPKHFVECGYPRNEKPILLLNEEKPVLKKLHDYKHVIIYLPTFREKGKNLHPLTNEQIRKFIVDNKILWLEKAHSAEKNNVQIVGEDNFYNLNRDFDINVLLPKIDLLITDYSSVCYDAFFVNKPVIFYSPDYQQYIEAERGFLCDYQSVTGAFCVYNDTELLEMMRLFTSNKNNEELKQHSMLQKKLIYDKDFTYETICNEIFVNEGQNHYEDADNKNQATSH